MPCGDKVDAFLGWLFFVPNKMKNQNPAARTKAAGRKPQLEALPELLTVTLSAEASDCVRRFAEEFGEELNDVATGALLDTLPQALDQWEETKARKKEGKQCPLDYWKGSLESVRQAKAERLAQQRESRGGMAARTFAVELSGLTLEAFLAMCKNDKEDPAMWLQKSIFFAITQFYARNMLNQTLRKAAALKKKAAR